MGFKKQMGIPGLVNKQFAIEHGYRHSGFTHEQNGGSFHSYVNVYQRAWE